MMVLVRGDMDKDVEGRWVRVGDLLNAAGITVTGTPLSELSAENAELQRRLEVHRVANANYSKVIDDLRSDVQKLTDSNAEADRTIADLKGNLERLGDTFRTVCDDRDAIAKENDTLRNNIGVLTVEIDRLKAEHRRIVDSFDKSYTDNLHGKIAVDEKKIHDLRTEIATLKAKNAELDAARQERDEWLAERDREIADLLAALATVKHVVRFMP